MRYLIISFLFAIEFITNFFSISFAYFTNWTSTSFYCHGNRRHLSECNEIIGQHNRSSLIRRREFSSIKEAPFLLIRHTEKLLSSGLVLLIGDASYNGYISSSNKRIVFPTLSIPCHEHTTTYSLD